MQQRSLRVCKLSGLLLAWLLVSCVELPEQAPVAATPVPAEVEAAAETAAVAAPVQEMQAKLPEPLPEIADVEPAIVEEPVAVPDTGSKNTAHAAAEAMRVRQYQASVDVLCEQIGNKLGSVSVDDCHAQGFVFGGGFSVNQRPLVIKEQAPVAAPGDAPRVLIMGGIHGDEYSSISIMFKWLGLFSAEGPEGGFHWRFAPLVNPDGLLDGGQAQRQNANGVDLNRNFPSHDWNATAATYWQESTGSNPRRFPGRTAASEPEVQWVVNQIEQFQPDVIVSVHAPYHLLDFDGPARAPDRIGELYLHQLGIYPGSLGNFAGLNRRIPVVTLELPSAGIMPPAEQISLMWRDLVAWLDREARKGMATTASTL